MAIRGNKGCNMIKAMELPPMLYLFLFVPLTIQSTVVQVSNPIHTQQRLVRFLLDKVDQALTFNVFQERTSPPAAA